jgi:hypothetical protein
MVEIQFREQTRALLSHEMCYEELRMDLLLWQSTDFYGETESTLRTEGCFTLNVTCNDTVY